MIVDDESVGMWREAVVAYLKALSQYSSEEIYENSPGSVSSDGIRSDTS
jgi:hypothetical protein